MHVCIVRSLRRGGVEGRDKSVVREFRRWDRKRSLGQVKELQKFHKCSPLSVMGKEMERIIEVREKRG